MVLGKGAAGGGGEKGFPAPRDLQWCGNQHADLKCSDTTDS